MNMLFACLNRGACVAGIAIACYDQAIAVAFNNPNCTISGNQAMSTSLKVKPRMLHLSSKTSHHPVETH